METNRQMLDLVADLSVDVWRWRMVAERQFLRRLQANRKQTGAPRSTRPQSERVWRIMTPTRPHIDVPNVVWPDQASAIAGPREFQILGDHDAYLFSVLDGALTFRFD